MSSCVLEMPSSQNFECTNEFDITGVLKLLSFGNACEDRGRPSHVFQPEAIDHTRLANIIRSIAGQI